ncbi:ROK family transcriptional regulator [Pontibacillus sp. ALD_SL1]|uniref:ROK family transcriptional regulator n=1 Tax=Pontibacillus sp. ALD_SL1 TaxID=2777185 RepID=UPI001A96DC9D|nr:ROK family transcriptional regulator [Pontibacillus sp. ALD_SL1]QST00335.1 ROK family transcriptional regulator [Pontibacillus sp. ALD_SL1]
MRIGNKALIKELNQSHVFTTIRSHQSISRTQISKVLNLGLSTVTYITEELVEAGLVVENGTAHSTGGRKATLLTFNEEYGYAFGVKIEEDQVIVACTNLNAKILRKETFTYEKETEPSKLLERVILQIKQIIQEMNLPEKKLIGIGMASSGLINHKQGIIIRSTLLGWSNENVREQMSEAFNVPIFIDNNVNAYTKAERQFGYGQGLNDFLCISIGAGVGASLFTNGEVNAGHHGGAGEVGHMVIKQNGYPCHCGQKGCLEMHASERFLEEEGRQTKHLYPDSPLHHKGFTFEQVASAAQSGDALAIGLFEELGKNLGIGVLNCINLLNPSAVIFIGEGLVAQEFFMTYTIDKASDNFFSKAGCDVGFQVSKLGEDAWVQGAALQAIDHWLEHPINEESRLLLS